MILLKDNRSYIKYDQTNDINIVALREALCIHFYIMMHLSESISYFSVCVNITLSSWWRRHNNIVSAPFSRSYVGVFESK